MDIREAPVMTDVCGWVHLQSRLEGMYQHLRIGSKEACVMSEAGGGRGG